MSARTVPPGAIRIRQGQHLLLITRNVHASHIAGARAQGVYDDGTDFSFYVESAILDTTRIQELWYSNEAATQDGWITQAYAGSFQAVLRVQRGETWAELYTVQGKDPSQARAYLCRGYIQTAHNIVLGETQIAGPGGGHGWINPAISLADPAAGIEFSTQTVPTGAVWRVRGMTCAVGLVTDATAGNRQLQLRMGDGSNAFGGGKSDPIPPSSTSPIIGGIGVPTSGTAIAVGATAGVTLPDTILVAGSTIAFVTRNLAAADNYGLGTLQVEEWVVP